MELEIEAACRGSVLASLNPHAKPSCEERQGRSRRLRRKPRSRSRCLTRDNQVRLSARHKGLMAAKNADSWQRPLTKGATPQGKTESMATHVDAQLKAFHGPRFDSGQLHQIIGRGIALCAKSVPLLLAFWEGLGWPPNLTRGTQGRCALASTTRDEVVKGTLGFPEGSIFQGETN